MVGDILASKSACSRSKGHDEIEFEQGLETLSKRWERFDIPGSGGGPLHAFGVWFQQHMIKTSRHSKENRSKCR